MHDGFLSVCKVCPYSGNADLKVSGALIGIDRVFVFIGTISKATEKSLANLDQTFVC